MFSKLAALILLNMNAHAPSVLKRNIPITTARSQFMIRFLFWSFGVQIARKSVIIQTMEKLNTIIPKLPFTRFFRSALRSACLIPKISTKNRACSGWNAIYQSQLPKNITATRRIDPMNFKIVAVDTGSRDFLGGGVSGVGVFDPRGGGGGGVVFPQEGEDGGVLAPCTLEVFAVRMISWRSDELVVAVLRGWVVDPQDTTGLLHVWGFGTIGSWGFISKY